MVVVVVVVAAVAVVVVVVVVVAAAAAAAAAARSSSSTWTTSGYAWVAFGRCAASFSTALAREWVILPVSVSNNTPFTRAFALQSSSRNSSPAPD